ncbi:MAG: protein phosphatase 2C domain-containing protein [Pseudomonadales bacterium]
MISIIGATHPGQRGHNEDCFIASSAQGVGLVADGMGGYACGEVASDMVKQIIEEAVSNNEGLTEAIARAHAVVKEAAAADEKKAGMGSTAIVFKMQGMDYELAWVGDSRAYLWSKNQGELRQITRDHSYVETLLSSGAISKQEAINHPNRNLITQAVGVAGENGLEIEVIHGRLGVGQQLMICSDGLVDEVLDRDIASLMSAATNSEEALNSLVTAAVEAGGRDNITVVLASIENDLAVDDPALEREAIAPVAVRTTFLNEGPQPAAPSGSPPVKDFIETAVHEAKEASIVNTKWAGIIDVVTLNAHMIVSGMVVAIVVVGVLFYLS